MRAELLVDGAQFWPRLREDLASAREQVLVQTYSFEGDSSGRAVAAALGAAPAPDRRLVVDQFAWHRMSDRFRFHPKHLIDRSVWEEWRATRAMVRGLIRDGVGVRFTNPVGWLYTRLPVRNHKKLVVIDRRVAYLGGINLTDHNFFWHDLMLRIEDDAVASFLADDFSWTWRGVHQATARRFGDFDLHVLSGRRNEIQFGMLLDLLSSASKRIFVESPYLAPPFSDALHAASARGVKVTVVTPETNNWRLCQDHIHGKAATSPIELRLYPDRMTHMKAMLIDDRHLVVGSANFELWSYRFQQEFLVIASAPELVEQFRTKIERPDLAASRPYRPEPSRIRSRWADFQLRWIERFMLALLGHADWSA